MAETDFQDVNQTSRMDRIATAKDGEMKVNLAVENAMSNSIRDKF